MSDLEKLFFKIDKEVEEIKKKIVSGELKVPDNKADFEAKYGDVYELDN